MSAILLSVNVGPLREILHQGQTVTTGIYKSPVAGAVWLRRRNLREQLARAARLPALSPIWRAAMEKKLASDPLPPSRGKDGMGAAHQGLQPTLPPQSEKGRA